MSYVLESTWTEAFWSVAVNSEYFLCIDVWHTADTIIPKAVLKYKSDHSKICAVR